ncbi:hypothetical protein Scep_011894 [Stephania cephalantha]|uniref:FAD-binding PCMH-type domain-containing protein n=2 Tax=Stephania cephalantha TaxID=152367 RepID=A0AAP0JDY6_9MAGN
MSWGWTFLFSILLSFPTAYSSTTKIFTNQGIDDFLECLAVNSDQYGKIEVYAPKDASYMKILQSAIRNDRFKSPETPKPLLIVTPRHESQVQATVSCSRKHGLQIRVRSGGHDFEGLSYTSSLLVPFVMIDLANLRAIDVDIEDNSAWVQAGATIGELYYRIAMESPIHGFPAGFVTTIGVGGHFSVGGYGAMMRKYGLAADNVVDARLVNVNGEILDRDTMGEDLFWAIRGGGASSFGVILAFKIKLVQVPPVLTVSKLTIKQGALEIIQRWQHIAIYEVPKELFIQVQISRTKFQRNLQSELQIMFLGRSEELMHIMEEKFPQLRIKKNDCMEMSWIESVLLFAEFPKTAPLDVLLNRTTERDIAFKVKSDFVTTPLSKREFRKIFNKFLEEKQFASVLSPWGGRMHEISDDEIAFPHRAGNMYVIAYTSLWSDEEGAQASQEHVKWVREMYNYMSPYVSKSPRAAYIGLRDLDLGFYKINTTPTYSEARIWGEKYFKGNFDKLVKVKSEVDPSNFFGDDQSIPPMTLQSES